MIMGDDTYPHINPPAVVERSMASQVWVLILSAALLALLIWAINKRVHDDYRRIATVASIVVITWVSIIVLMMTPHYLRLSGGAETIDRSVIATNSLLTPRTEMVSLFPGEFPFSRTVTNHRLRFFDNKTPRGTLVFSDETGTGQRKVFRVFDRGTAGKAKVGNLVTTVYLRPGDAVQAILPPGDYDVVAIAGDEWNGGFFGNVTAEYLGPVLLSRNIRRPSAEIILGAKDQRSMPVDPKWMEVTIEEWR